MSGDIVRGLECLVIVNRVLSFLAADVLEAMVIRRVSRTFQDAVENYCAEFWQSAVHLSKHNVLHNTTLPAGIIISTRLHKFCARILLPLLREGADVRWMLRGLCDSGFSLATTVVPSQDEIGYAMPFLHQLISDAALCIEYPVENSILEAMDFLLTAGKLNAIARRAATPVDLSGGSSAAAGATATAAEKEFENRVVNCVARQMTPLAYAVKRGAGAEMCRVLMSHGANILGPMHLHPQEPADRPLFVALLYNRIEEIKAMLQYLADRDGKEAVVRVLRMWWKPASQSTETFDAASYSVFIPATTVQEQKSALWNRGLSTRTLMCALSSREMGEIVLSWVNSVEDINGDFPAIVGSADSNDAAQTAAAAASPPPPPPLKPYEFGRTDLLYYTPLMSACRRRSVDVVKLLLETGKADVWAETTHLETSALSLITCNDKTRTAPEERRCAILELLLQQPGLKVTSQSVVLAGLKADGVKICAMLIKANVRVSDYCAKLVGYYMEDEKTKQGAAVKRRLLENKLEKELNKEEET